MEQVSERKKEKYTELAGLGVHTSIVTALDAGVQLAEVARRVSKRRACEPSDRWLSPRRRAARTRGIRKVNKLVLIR